MGKKAKARVRVGKASGRTKPYSYEFRLQIVRLYLEERCNTTVLREQFGVSSHSVHRWAKACRHRWFPILLPSRDRLPVHQRHLFLQLFAHFVVDPFLEYIVIMTCFATFMLLHRERKIYCKMRIFI